MSKKRNAEDENLMNGERSDSQSQELPSTLSYEELQTKFREAQNNAQQYWERILRMQADSDNLMRRNERDIANAHKYALEKFTGELLPIVDSLELCTNSIPENANEQTMAIVEGVNLTLKMFYNAMEKFGIKQINPLNQPFNPEFEQAISVLEDAKLKPGIVTSVLQKGYTLNNRLVRPALVVVSKKPE